MTVEEEKEEGGGGSPLMKMLMKPVHIFSHTFKYMLQI
jgi:hypothetical protein